MITSRFFVAACLFAVALPAAGADAAAAALLAKSVAAFQKNLARQKQWNWTIFETRALTDKAGKTVQTMPSVTSESIIRSDGRRCNAVTAWGDGREPYLKNAGADERCQAYNAIGTPFDVAALLTSSNAGLVRRTASAIVISVLPVKSKIKSPNFAVRCAASLKATVELDPASLFPLSIEGDVAESGCDSQFVPVVHEGAATREPMVSQFRKGAAFRVTYALQKDKFDNPENSYWISVTQHYSQPWNKDSRLLYYWGRQFRVPPNNASRMVKDIKTTAQEFGAGSQLRFDK
uniref:Uncharacterized protein n=1 Tax=Solibacter usitatus (strain Ellin6076) TaxID=234267 RepID=Q027V6_SOLUE